MNQHIIEALLDGKARVMDRLMVKIIPHAVWWHHEQEINRRLRRELELQERQIN